MTKEERIEQCRRIAKLGGRPKGAKNEKTLEKEAVLAAFKERVMQNADKLLNAQMQLAIGTQYLYKIVTTGEGKTLKKEHVLVTDPHEIKEYLDGDFEGGEDYYYMTTKDPNNLALDSLLNRTFGRPTDKLDITTKGESLNIATDKVRNLADELRNNHRRRSLGSDGAVSNSVD